MFLRSRSQRCLHAAAVLALVTPVAVGCARTDDAVQHRSIKDSVSIRAPEAASPVRVLRTSASAPVAPSRQRVLTSAEKILVDDAPRPLAPKAQVAVLPPVVEVPSVVAPKPVIVQLPVVQAPPVQPPTAAATPVIAEARPSVDTRRAAPKVDGPTPNAALPPPAPASTGIVAAPVAAATALPKFSEIPAATSAPAVPQARVAAGPAVTVPQALPVPLPPAIAAPKIVVLTDEQRLRTAISRSRDYLKSGRITEARSVLDDVAKGMNPDVLFALAETFDPLHLREAYPKLARAGDATRAVALYEQALSKGGAASATARISALKAMPAFRATP